MPVNVTLSNEFIAQVDCAVEDGRPDFALHLCRKLLDYLESGYNIAHIVYPASTPYDWAADNRPPNYQHSHYDDHPAGGGL